MQIFTVRIKDQSGVASVTNYSFSQVAELLEGVSKENARKFFAGKESINTSVGNLKLVDMEKLKKSLV